MPSCKAFKVPSGAQTLVVTMLEGQAGTQKKNGKRTLKLLLDAFKNRDGCFKPFFVCYV